MSTHAPQPHAQRPHGPGAKNAIAMALATAGEGGTTSPLTPEVLAMLMEELEAHPQYQGRWGLEVAIMARGSAVVKTLDNGADALQTILNFREKRGAPSTLTDLLKEATTREVTTRLNAAAPDLLAACESVLNAIDAFPHSKQRTPFGKPDGGIAKMLRAAVAKAKGGT